MKHAPRFLSLCEKVQAEIPRISIETWLDPGSPIKGALLIDVREDHEWVDGHLPDAVHIGRGILERDIEGRVPSLDTTIVLYCGGGYRSALATKSLLEMGYRSVYSLDGGYRRWVELFPDRVVRSRP